jgi:uncharacterized protein
MYVTRVSALPAPASTREPLVDLLRGLALLGILVVNLEFHSQPLLQGWQDVTEGPNATARWLIITVFQAKFYILFSFLFGYGLVVQMRSAERAGASFGRRYARRLIGLFALGVLHGVLLFAGDILMAYAVLGGLLYFFRNVDDQVALLMAVAAAAAGMVVIALAGLAEALSPTGAAADDVRRAIEVYSTGSFGEITMQRLVDLAFAQGTVLLGQGPFAFACFLLGMVAARRRLLADPLSRERLLRRLRLVALPIGLGVSAAAAYLIVYVGSGLAEAAGLFLQIAVSIPLTAGYVALIALAWATGGLRRLAWLAEPAGRMSLTVYLSQSIVAATLFMAWGFGLFGTLQPVAALGLAAAMWVGLALGARLWLRWFAIGPFEWVLRSWTYGRRMPLRRTAA